MKIREIILEDKEEYVTQTVGDKMLDALQNDNSVTGKRFYQSISNQEQPKVLLVKKIKEADPTRNGVYLVWLARMFLANQFKIEDLGRIKQELEFFEKVKPKLKNRDLNSYKSLEELYNVLEPLKPKNKEEEEALKSGKAQAKDIKQAGAQYLINSPNYKALIPKTEEAACLYGKNTKWCTTSGEFENYSSQGDLVILMANINNKLRKFQLHVETGQAMNELDQPITKQEIAELSRYPEHAKLLNMLIDKHYNVS